MISRRELWRAVDRPPDSSDLTFNQRFEVAVMNRKTGIRRQLLVDWRAEMMNLNFYEVR